MDQKQLGEFNKELAVLLAKYGVDMRIEQKIVIVEAQPKVTQSAKKK